jgi:hypothetical protein
MNIREFNFSSLDELVEIAKTAPETCSGRNPACNSFAGGTWEEALEQATRGSAELVADIVEASMLASSTAGDCLEFDRDVSGDFFDVGDFLAGEPECWWNEQGEAKREAINIIVNVGFWAGMSAENIKKRGGALVGLIDNLQRQGYIVNLNVCVMTYDRIKKEYVRILVNTGTRPLDIANIAYMVANPLFLRRIVFAFWATYREKKDAYEMQVCDDTNILNTQGDERYIYFAADFQDRPENELKEYISGKIDEYKTGSQKITYMY